jgi:hypothetical protein
MAAKIQHCPISSKCDMWVDNDVPNWFPTLKNFYHLPFSKWSPQYRTNSTLSDFNDISYVGRLWCPELILTSKNFYRSPFPKWPPQYHLNSTLFDFNDISYVGSLWCPDIVKFLAVAIFKMAAKIQHCPISSKFVMWVDNDVPNWFPTLKNFYRLPFSKWPPQYRTNSTLSDFNDISYVGRLWCPELILTSKNFYQSPFSKWLPQYCKNSTLFDFKGSF